MSDSLLDFAQPCIRRRASEVWALSSCTVESPSVIPTLIVDNRPVRVLFRDLFYLLSDGIRVPRCGFHLCRAFEY